MSCFNWRSLERVCGTTSTSSRASILSSVPTAISTRAGIALAIIFYYSLSASPTAFAARLAADRASRIMATLRDATGCRGWQRLTAVKIRGTHTGGGLDGTYDTALDAKDGRSVTRSYSGDLSSADGYDGRQPWSTDYSKGTLVMNAPSAQATAVSHAWIDAHGWCEAGAEVRYRYLRTARLDAGRATADVISAVLRGGARVTLFVDQASHLLDQTSLALDENNEVVSNSDWRTVDDAAVPFNFVASNPILPAMRYAPVAQMPRDKLGWETSRHYPTWSALRVGGSQCSLCHLRA